MDRHPRPARRLVPNELEQVMRLARFRHAHPGVIVGAGRGWWQAVIPEPDGEQVITRQTPWPTARQARRGDRRVDGSAPTPATLRALKSG